MSTIRRHLMPTTDTAGGDTAVPTATDVVRTPRLPRKDSDVGTVATTAATVWLNYPGLTLAWITQADLADKAQAYNTALGKRKSAGGARPSKTQALDLLDRQIDAGLSSIKIDIQQKFTKPLATAQYARYGVEKRGNNYLLPIDRDERLPALLMAAEAAGADGTGGAQYSAAFWTGMHAAYKAALEDAGSNDSTISATAKDKNNLKAEILKAMRSLMLIIQGNYPETYEAMYREFGWQKENY